MLSFGREAPVRIVRNKESLTITWKTPPYMGIGLACMAFSMLPLMSLTFDIVSSSEGSTDMHARAGSMDMIASMDWLFWLAYAGSVLCTYAGLMLAFGRITVLATRDALSARIGPIPMFRDASYAVAHIRRICASEAACLFPGTAGPLRFVDLCLRNGKVRHLHGYLLSRKASVEIVRELQEFYGMQEPPVQCAGPYGIAARW
jgi:hypothetical protein